MKLLRLLFHFTAGLALLGGASCKKEDRDKDGLAFIGGLPYYHFTDDDRQWLHTKQGDEWKLVNGRGYQRVYRVGQLIETIQGEDKSTSMGIPSSTKVLGYYDQTIVRIYRADSARGGGAELRFIRDAAMLSTLNSGGFDKSTSQFYAEGEWYDFVGNTDLISDYYTCQGLKFPHAAALNGPFQQLTVRGHTYTEVVAFIGTSRGPTCAPVPPSYMQELYYDRQAGLVRMVSQAGEAWDRVP